MGYLVCNKCGSYYELQPGETVEDFLDECECGGKLEYKVTIPTGKIKTTETTEDKEDILSVWKKQSTPIKALSLIGVCLVAFLLIGAVMGMFNPNTTTPQSSQPIMNNDTQNTTSQVQATWHSIGKFNTLNGDTPTFQIKGNQFKVIIDATSDAKFSENIHYSIVSFEVYPEDKKGYEKQKFLVNKGEVKFSNSSTEKREFNIYTNPGTYYLTITSANVKEVSVQIVDYY